MSLMLLISFHVAWKELRLMGSWTSHLLLRKHKVRKRTARLVLHQPEPLDSEMLACLSDRAAWLSGNKKTTPLLTLLQRIFLTA
ncbi:hypothetical protein YC2023_090190 [Brassica napus]